MLTAALGFLLGYWFAKYLPRYLYLVRIARAQIKAGICFNYQGSGVREVRDGTLSDYCVKCGHCAGYHWWTWRNQR